MRLSIRGAKIHISPRMRAYIERRVYLALSRFGTRLTRVQVRLAEPGGARRGADRSCTVMVTVRGMAPLVVEHRDARVTLAVNHALARVARLVARTVELMDWRMTGSGAWRTRSAGRRSG